jgi:hypothetical protein
MSGSPEFEVDLEDCMGLTELIASLGFAYLKLGQGLGSSGFRPTCQVRFYNNGLNLLNKFKNQTKQTRKLENKGKTIKILNKLVKIKLLSM